MILGFIFGTRRSELEAIQKEGWRKVLFERNMHEPGDGTPGNPGHFMIDFAQTTAGDQQVRPLTAKSCILTRSACRCLCKEERPLPGGLQSPDGKIKLVKHLCPCNLVDDADKLPASQVKT